ncbi:MAG: bacillithiol system redox-active protein YtxJ [Flavobacterium sp.]
MSFFKDIFGNNDSKDTAHSALAWNDLTQLQQLDAIAEESKSQPALIFKHSTRCSISRMALKNFEREYAIAVDDAKPYYLDLLEHRHISNEIASRFGVTHQSPQLIIIKDGVAIYNASHSDIDAEVAKKKIA